MKTETKKVIVFTRDNGKAFLNMTVHDKPNADGVYGYALEDNGIFAPASEHPIRMKEIEGKPSYYIDLNKKG
jgi:hypothetical protein